MQHIGEVSFEVPDWRRWSWRDRIPSNRQRAILVDRGYVCPPTRGEAADIIAEIAVEEEWR